MMIATALGDSVGASGLEPLTVLIVDDDLPVIRGMSELLEGEGYDVAIALDGLGALDQLRRGLRPYAIVLDLMMPVMDGWEFCAEQAKDAALSAIPVGVISALGPIVKSPHRMNDAGNFSKPADPNRILQTVASYCGTHGVGS